MTLRSSSREANTRNRRRRLKEENRHSKSTCSRRESDGRHNSITCRTRRLWENNVQTVCVNIETLRWSFYLCPWARQEVFDSYSPSRSREWSFHNASHKRLHQSRRDGPPFLYFIQDLGKAARWIQAITDAENKMGTSGAPAPTQDWEQQSDWVSALKEIIY